MSQSLKNARQTLDIAVDSKRTRHIFFHLAAALLLLSAGCTSPHYFQAQADSRYTGIKLRDWDKPGDNRTIRVLLVHGMDDTPFGSLGVYSPNLLGAPSYARLQMQLPTISTDGSFQKRVIDAAVAAQWYSFIKNATDSSRYIETTAKNYEFKLVKDDSGRTVGYTFTRTFEPKGGGGVAIKFYVADWGLGASVLKEQQFGAWAGATGPQVKGAEGSIDDFDPDLNRNRAPLNKLLKLHTMDWGLGDAALYIGDAGSIFRLPVKAALLQLTSESQHDDRTAIVTQSLGSTITLDVLAALVQSRNSVRTIFAPGTNSGEFTPSNTVFYMFANQYGLLTIGRQPAINRLDAALASTGAAGSKTNSAVQVYAFTDPNDLLSYPLNPKLDHITTCNVYVRNHAFTLGIGTDPLETHVNYQINPVVRDVIFNGPKHVVIAGRE